MLRMISQIDRRADMSLARFSEHWRTVHRAHALALVPAGIMLGYVQNHRLDMPVSGLVPPCDGSPELWVDSADALVRLASSPAYTEGAALDEANFMEGGARTFLGEAFERPGDAAREAVAGTTKLLLCYSVQPGLARHQVADAWRRDGLTLSASSDVRRAELYLGLEPAADGVLPCVEAIWWASEPDFRRAWARREDCISTVVDRAGIKGMLVEELPILWPNDGLLEKTGRQE